MFDIHQIRMIGLPCGEKNYDNMLSRFNRIPERNGQTDRQTDGQTDLLYQYRASVCWRAIKREMQDQGYRTDIKSETLRTVVKMGFFDKIDNVIIMQHSAWLGIIDVLFDLHEQLSTTLRVPLCDQACR